MEVKAYSNSDSVELFINQATQGVAKSNNKIFKWTNIKIDSGANEVEVAGYFGNQILHDSCIWSYVRNSGNTHPDSIAPGEIQIIFQLSSTNTPKNYLEDDGSAFGDRQNGYSYGWSADNKSNARQRNLHQDIRFDTFIHMQKGATQFWEIAVPNGKYLISIVAGDPGYTDSYHKIEAEEKVILEGQPNPNHLFIFGSDTITVNDGRLTVKLAIGSSNAKINFIHISSVVTGINQSGPSNNRLPLKTELYPNYPNPFNAQTTIRFKLNKTANAKLKAFNMLGQAVKTLVDEKKTVGEHKITWDGTDELGNVAASGLYLYKLELDEYVQVKKMLLLR